VRVPKLLLLGVAASLAFAAYASSDGDAVDEAAEKTRSAPRIIVSTGGNKQLLLSRDLTVIKRGDRVIAWTATDEEFTWRRRQRCYERHTEWNRDDARQLGEALVPTDLSDIDVSERNGARVISGRAVHQDHADTEYRLTLDESGRVVKTESRAAAFGALAASRWHSRTYRYPDAAEFAEAAGTAPAPRCR
jgi:hypothetical protein